MNTILQHTRALNVFCNDSQHKRKTMHRKGAPDLSRTSDEFLQIKPQLLKEQITLPSYKSLCSGGLHALSDE